MYVFIHAMSIFRHVFFRVNLNTSWAHRKKAFLIPTKVNNILSAMKSTFHVLHLNFIEKKRILYNSYSYFNDINLS